MKSGRGLWNYLENCRELNCLQGRKHPGWDVWGNEVEGSASSRILENAGKGDGNRGICISTQRFDKGKK